MSAEVLIGIIALVVGLAIVANRSSGMESICTECGHRGYARRRTRGSILIEIILWLCFLLPGLIYSVWRLTTREAVCARCAKPATIPLDTPRGQQLARQYPQTKTEPTL